MGCSKVVELMTARALDQFTAGMRHSLAHLVPSIVVKSMYGNQGEGKGSVGVSYCLPSPLSRSLQANVPLNHSA